MISLVIPSFIRGFLGIIPIIIDIKNLIEYHKKNKESDTNSTSKNKLLRTTKFSTPSLPSLSVATVTFSNGGDNIGIYTPLFASNNTIDQTVILFIIVVIMTAVWCVL